jgi:hypothetical protein
MSWYLEALVSHKGTPLPLRILIVVLTALLCSTMAPSPSAAQAPREPGPPTYKKAWTVLNGPARDRAVVRRVVRRLNFPHKAFVGRYVAFRFVRKFANPEVDGAAGGASGHVLISLKSLRHGVNQWTVAHEIGHAFDLLTLSPRGTRQHERLVRRYAHRGDCLHPRFKFDPRRPELVYRHDCSFSEELASAFARAYCSCPPAHRQREGYRVPLFKMRRFFRNAARPRLNFTTDTVKVPCWVDSPTSSYRGMVNVPYPECEDSWGTPNPVFVDCSFNDGSEEETMLKEECAAQEGTPVREGVAPPPSRD